MVIHINTIYWPLPHIILAWPCFRKNKINKLINVLSTLISVLRTVYTIFVVFFFFDSTTNWIDVVDVLTCTINNKKLNRRRRKSIKNLPATVHSQMVINSFVLSFSLPQSNLTHIAASSAVAVFADNLTTLNLLRHYFCACACFLLLEFDWLKHSRFVAIELMTSTLCSSYNAILFLDLCSMFFIGFALFSLKKCCFGIW